MKKAWALSYQLSAHGYQCFFMQTAKTLIRLGGCPDWSDSLLGADSLCWLTKPTKWVCAQRTLRVFAGRTLTLLADKTKKMSVRPAKTQISLGIHPVWLESSLCAQLVAKGPRFLHTDSWVFAGRTLILLVLSCRSSYIDIITPTGYWSN